MKATDRVWTDIILFYRVFLSELTGQSDTNYTEPMSVTELIGYAKKRVSSKTRLIYIYYCLTKKTDVMGDWSIAQCVFLKVDYRLLNCKCMKEKSSEVIYIKIILRI